jgi:hypothetical protein
MIELVLLTRTAYSERNFRRTAETKKVHSSDEE